MKLMQNCSGTKPCVLVVEDDHDTRVALRDSLEEFGYGVCSAADGSTAIAMLKSQCTRPKVIVLDFAMPIMNGFDFFKSIRADDLLKNIPVVVMSAFANAGSIPGADAFMAKPLDLQGMIDTVQRFAPVLK
jgi:CheY-like chemotaxis protein